VVLLVVLLIVLSVMFGGFQKGTKVNGLGPVHGPITVARHAEAAVGVGWSGAEWGGRSRRLHELSPFR
jgi:hypothetical protein